MITNLRAMAGELSGEAWIEKIDFQVRSPLDLRELARGGDLLGELLRDIEAIADDPRRLGELATLLEPLMKKVGPELASEQGESAGDEHVARARLNAWLADARDLLVAALTETLA